MRRFTEDQITLVLRKVEGGTPVNKVCWSMGMAQATLCGWKKKLGSLGVAEVQWSKKLEQENRKLKHLVVDMSLDGKMLQDVLSNTGRACPPAFGCGVLAAGLPG